METKELISGIGVVIDDAVTDASMGERNLIEDSISRIVEWFESEWNLPFVRKKALPKEALWANLFRSASFVLLDWRLWGDGGEELKSRTIEDIKKFLEAARENLIPIFILTNENPDDVKSELQGLSDDVYEEDSSGRNFVFVRQKSEFWDGTSVNVEILEKWVYGNASVYALKTWHRVMGNAKSELFKAMCQRSVNWPRIFWETYKEDGADPSVSLTNLINDNVRGRMRTDGFEDKYLNTSTDDVSTEELKGLIAETSFLSNNILPADEIRCGDLYKREKQKYWLNLRPDCDCIPRGGVDARAVEVYCVEGERLRPGELRKLFKNGHFEERVFQSVVFGVINGNSILFDFHKLRVCQYSEVSEHRVGRLLHPYITRVQQRYALFLQRQALPRIPNQAI